MKLIATIEDKVKINQVHITKKRYAARAVVFNGEAVALLHVSRDSYDKLPGGGTEKDESTIQTLEREIIEEIGCEIDSIQEIGRVDEIRALHKLHQVSYCYIARCKSEKYPPMFTQKEIDAGFKVLWVKSINDAIKALENDTPNSYEGEFIQKRDLIILKEARKFIKN